MSQNIYLPESKIRQHTSSFRAHGVQLVGINAQHFQNGGRHLSGTDRTVVCLRCQARVRQQQNHVGIVMGESPVLFLLGFAFRNT